MIAASHGTLHQDSPGIPGHRPRTRAAITCAGVTLFLSLMSRLLNNTGLGSWEGNVALRTVMGSRLPLWRQDAVRYSRGGLTGEVSKPRAMANPPTHKPVSLVPFLPNPGSDQPVALGVPLRD